jgi:macrolide transport system ATP-binding/permease protein
MPEWKEEIRQRLVNLNLAPTREAAIIEELAQHLDDCYTELLSSGEAPAKAYRQTLAELSGSDLLQQELRRVERQIKQAPLILGTNRRTNMIADFWQDLRYGARMLLKQPVFTLIAVVTLALGIGVNTALFTGFNLFLRPKPIKDPDTVVRFEYQGSRREERFSYPEYAYFRDHTQVCSDVIANFQEKFLLGEKTSGVEPEEITGNFVSDNYFATLGGGARPSAGPIGRFFTPEENRVAGRDAVIVLSHHFWQRRFGGDPQIVGRSLLLNGQPFTVIGVTSPAFVGLRYEMPDIWLPLMMRAALATVYFEEIAPEKRDWFNGQRLQWLNLHARLKPGQTVPEAQAELGLLYKQLANTRAADEQQASLNVVSVSDIGADNEVWQIMALVLSASGLVLLIACSNIANMLLARAAARQKEIGVRLCLGASRGRLIRQLLTESIMLAALGGAAGVWLAWWSLDLLLAAALTRYGGGDATRLALNLAPDARVLTFSLLLSLLSGLAFGLAPALRATRADLVSVIKDEGAGVSGRAARSWLRSGLVVAQVSLCLVLLIPAGLLLRGLERVLATNPGFEAKQVLQVGYSLELSGYDAPRALLFQQQLIARLAALPGVQAVSLDRGFGGRATITLLDEPGTSPRQFTRAPFDGIPANYLATIGTPLLQGRNFTEEEVKAKAPVIIVSESTARNLWPGQNPLGKALRLEEPLRNRSDVILPRGQVIGVARDNQIYRVGQIPPLYVYVPQELPGEMDTVVLVRAKGDAASLKEQARKEAHALEPVLRLFVGTMEERITRDKNVLSTRAASELAAFLGGLALLLAALGLYGVMAWSVAQRTREIGIRMALGAERRAVLALVLRQGMRLVLFGVVLGVAASLAVTQVMKSMLFGLSATDPATYAGVTLLLMGVALLACYLPARRATKVDPLVALRCE